MSKHRERLATCAVLWRPVDGPLVSDEASSDRQAALRKWRGQDEDDAAVKPADACRP